MRRGDGDPRAEPSAGEGLDVLVGYQTSFFEADHTVADTHRFPWIARGGENQSPFVGVSTQQTAKPGRFPGGQPLRRIVEHQGVGVAQKRRRETEPSIHTERERTEPLVSETAEADDVKHLVRTRWRYTRHRAEHAQMPARRPRRMPRDIPEEDSDLARHVRHAVKWAAAKERYTSPVAELEH